MAGCKYIAMKHSIQLILIFLNLFIVGCSSDNSETRLKLTENKIGFEITGQKVFNIDEQTDYNLLFPQPFTRGSEELLMVLSVLHNSIDIYNYSDGELVNRIKFPSEGEMSIPATLVGYQAISEDTLLALDKLGNLYFSDMNSQIYGKVNLDPEGVPGLPLIQPNSLPLVKSGDSSLIIENYYLANADRKMKIELDLRSYTVNYKLKMPDEHMEGFWGLGDFAFYNFIYNKSQKQYIYNFTNLDSIYIWDTFLTKLKKMNARSRTLDSPVQKLLTMGVQPTKKFIEEGAYSSTIYARLLYDEYRDIYYRFIGMPINQGVLDMKDPVKSKQRKYLVMVLNSDFEWMGEFELPPYKYITDIERMFINERGLHIQQRGENEDQAVFDVWNAKF